VVCRLIAGVCVVCRLIAGVCGLEVGSWCVCVWSGG